MVSRSAVHVVDNAASISTDERIVPFAAIQVVDPGAAVKQVVLIATGQRIVAALTKEVPRDGGIVGRGIEGVVLVGEIDLVEVVVHQDGREGPIGVAQDLSG